MTILAIVVSSVVSYILVGGIIGGATLAHATLSGWWDICRDDGTVRTSGKDDREFLSIMTGIFWPIMGPVIIALMLSRWVSGRMLRQRIPKAKVRR